MGVLELGISILVAAGIVVRLTGLPAELGQLTTESMSDYLRYLYDILIAVELIKLLCRHDLSSMIEVLMFAVNPCYDLQPAGEDVEQLWEDKNYEAHLTNMDPDRQRLYEVCQRRGVGITVMKAFGGGDLLGSNQIAGVKLTVGE